LRASKRALFLQGEQSLPAGEKSVAVHKVTCHNDFHIDNLSKNHRKEATDCGAVSDHLALFL
jgi:hypothetical protein